MERRHRVVRVVWIVVLGAVLSFVSLGVYGQAPPEREPDAVLLRDGKRIDCVVVSVSNEVLYYNLLGRDGLQQVELHKVMTVVFGAPKVDLLAQAKREAEAKRVAEEAAKRAEEEAKAAQAKREAEERRRAEEARLAEEVRQAAARQAAEDARRAEEARKAEEQRKAEQAAQEAKANEAAQKAEEAAVKEVETPTKEKGSGNAVVPTQVVASDAWKSVTVTKNEGDVQGMLFVDKYDLTLTQSSNWSRVKSEEMELGATIQLQKRAVQRRATHLLIREVEIKRTYGEPPSIRIVGEAYRKRN